MIPIKRLQQRAALLRALRSFFTSRDFLEVDTPIRQPVIIPERYIEPLRSGKSYLQTSPELCMKRLLAGGCTKIFQICPCFRKDERGSRHLEEFTMLEWYRAGATYDQLMSDCEELLRYTAELLSQFNGEKDQHADIFPGLDLNGFWERLSVRDAFDRYCPCSLEDALESDNFEEMLVEHVEPLLGKGRPVFLIDYPVELGSLARLKPGAEGVVERFELYVDGVELANGFSELTDGVEQRERFTEEIAFIQKSWDPDIRMPERFLKDLPKMGNAAGIALGVDRLFMLGLGLGDITEAVSFSEQDFL